MRHGLKEEQDELVAVLLVDREEPHDAEDLRKDVDQLEGSVGARRLPEVDVFLRHRVAYGERQHAEESDK